MDSNMNHRHVQVHSAELHRRAELHRLAAQARSEGKTKPHREIPLHIPNPVSGLGRAIGRVTAAVRAARRPA